MPKLSSVLEGVPNAKFAERSVEPAGVAPATALRSDCAAVHTSLAIGGDDTVEVVQDREQVDSERDKVEVRDKEKGDKTRTNNARSNM